MRRRLFPVLFAGGGAVAVTYTISGAVYDADGITAVSGATVALGLLSAVSAVDGTYTISDVPAGASGSMTCTKAGYSWTAITVAEITESITGQNYTNAWWAATGIGASCQRAYKPKGAASQAASYINLANPGTGNAAPGTAPSWNAATGWTFVSASSQYLTTSLNPSSGDTSYMVQYSCPVTNAPSNQSVFGIYKGPDTRVELVIHPTGTVHSNPRNANTSYTPPLSGVCTIAGKKLYQDGVDKGDLTGTWSGSCTTDILIGARRREDTATIDQYWGNLGDNILAWAAYSIVLNSAQEAAIRAALTA
jgi:hypothetical protein